MWFDEVRCACILRRFDEVQCASINSFISLGDIGVLRVL